MGCSGYRSFVHLASRGLLRSWSQFTRLKTAESQSETIDVLRDSQSQVTDLFDELRNWAEARRLCNLKRQMPNFLTEVAQGADVLQKGTTG